MPNAAGLGEEHGCTYGGSITGVEDGVRWRGTRCGEIDARRELTGWQALSGYSLRHFRGPHETQTKRQILLQHTQAGASVHPPGALLADEHTVATAKTKRRDDFDIAKMHRWSKGKYMR